MPTRTGERNVLVQVRVEEDLAAVVERLRDEHGVPNQSEMVRALIRRGVKGVTDDAKTGSAPVRAQLTRVQYADRAAQIMEQLSDLVARCEAHDPAGARMLVAAIESASRAWLAQAKKTNGTTNTKRVVVRRR